MPKTPSNMAPRLLEVSRPAKMGSIWDCRCYQQSKDKLRPDATAIFVAAQHAAGAITDAIEAEIPLIVAVAEHIPLHDILRVQTGVRDPPKTVFDRFPDHCHVEDSISKPTGRRQCAWYHFSHRTLQNRISASSYIRLWSHRHHCQVWDTQL